MSDAMQVWTMFFGAATLFLILVQVAILAGLLWAFQSLRTASKKVSRLLEAEGIDPSHLVTDSYHALKSAEVAAEKAAQAAESVNQLIIETRSRIDRIEKAFQNWSDSMQDARLILRRNLARPIQEYRAITAAVRGLMNFLLHSS
jgi:hypothetical protein